MESTLLTCREAAAFLRVSEKTIWTLCHTGQLPRVQILRRVFIDKTDLEGFVVKNKTVTADRPSAEIRISEQG